MTEANQVPMDHGMTEEQIAAEIARQQAAIEWAALVKQCAERGDA